MVSRKRAALVLVLVAGVVATLIATWPAAATSTRAQAKPQTVNRFFFRDGPDAIPDAGGTIAQVTLPKGSWMVTVKLWVDRAAAGPDIFAGCGLGLGTGTGADGDAAAFVAPAKADGVVAGVITMTASHVYSSAGPVTVTCQDLGTNAQYHHLRIQAIKVGSIVRTQI